VETKHLVRAELGDGDYLNSHIIYTFRCVFSCLYLYSTLYESDEDTLCAFNNCYDVPMKEKI
jgi:hypothetical protein